MISTVPFHEWPVQNAAIKGLTGQIAEGNIPHAMLFVGSPLETEKLIEFLARMLLCQGTPSPCGHCESCKQMMAGTHPDYHVVNNGDGGTLKTGQVGDLQEHLMLRTHSGGRMVYVICGIDDATPAAANRLLKTLEEPSSSVVALLSCENPRRVLPTIRSRTFQYRLDAGEDHLAWDDTFHSQGEAKESQQIQSENPLFATLLERVIQWVEALLNGAEPVLLLADRFVKSFDSVDLSDVLQISVLWLRDAMHFALGDTEYVRFHEHQAELRKLSERISVQQFVKAIELVLDARSRMQVHVVGTLNIEQLCIRLREVIHGV